MNKLLPLFLLPFILCACNQNAPPTPIAAAPGSAAGSNVAHPPATATAATSAMEGRYPTLPLPSTANDMRHPSLVMDTSPVLGPDANPANPADLTFATGFLLTPIEQSPTYRKPDSFFIFRQGKIRMFAGPEFKQKWDALELPDNSPTVLLGSYGDISVFVQQSHVLGIDTDKGAIKWTLNMTMADAERERITQFAKRSRELIDNDADHDGMIYDSQTGAYNKATMTHAALAVDPDVGRDVIFNERLGKNMTQFTTMRMIGNRLIIVGGSTLSAYDIATGKSAWKDNAVLIPERLPTAVVGNNNLIVVQLDNDRGNPTFRVFDAATGKTKGDISLEKERWAWRGLSKDGIFLVVTDQSVSAYDCLAKDPSHPLWRRNDIKIKWAAASAVTPDGLVLVTADKDLDCLSIRSGENRWPIPSTAAPRLSIPGGRNPDPEKGGWTFLRSYVDGGLIIYQTQNGIEAFSTSNGEVSWASPMNADAGTNYAPMSLSQLADPYIITLATGNLRNGQRAANLISHDRRPSKGRISVFVLGQPGVKGAPSAEPPVIRAWQVIDNAIILETMGKTYLYKAKTEK